MSNAFWSKFVPFNHKPAKISRADSGYFYSLLQNESMGPSHKLDPDRQRLGERITSLRRSSGKSIRKLAEEIGTSHTTIQRLERGDSAVSFDIVYRALAALGRLDISIGDLGSDDNTCP